MTHPHDLVWDRWAEVDRIFEAALEYPPHERDRFLADSCRDDPDLQQAVRNLLAQVSTPSRLLSGPGPLVIGAIWPTTEHSVPEPAIAVGERVGRYRVLGELGRGGMATVYAAERADGAFQQEVALKVLRRGLDTDEVITRFLSERQILSGLAHPHIARLLDGGATDDGRPFLVTERVTGEAITVWADRQVLSVRDRLGLLLQVADAVQFAHTRLVVHRDLKPSNILVDADSQVKLLDFGIAKLLGPADGSTLGLTRAGLAPLTPGYASPEQVRGEAVTTASDVYQLGLLAYELLTGVRPFKGHGFELESGILQGRITRPSDLAVPAPGLAGGAPGVDSLQGMVEIARARSTTREGLRRVLRGDLDTILLKALRTEPEHRYVSVDSLADDLRRHLNGQPIRARSASRSYRLRKFASRNPWAAPVVSVLTIAIAGYVATLTLHSRNLERERNEARAQSERADELRTFLVDVFRVADPYETPDPSRNLEITVVEALDLGAQRARDELVGRPLLQAGILSAIADVYTNLDIRESARTLIEEAMVIRRREGADRSPEQLDDLGNLMLVVESPDSAVAIGERLVSLERELYGPDHPRHAGALLALAHPMTLLGRFEEALAHREEAIRILRAGGAAATDELAGALGLISNTYRVFGRLDDAETAARAAVEARERLYGLDHARTATDKSHLALILNDRKQHAEAIALYRDAIPVLERALGAEHFVTVNTRHNLGVTLLGRGDAAGAEFIYRSILEIRRRQASDGRSQEVANALQNLAVAVLRQDRPDEAERLIVEAYEMYRDLLPADHYVIAYPLLTRTEIQLAAGDPVGAEISAREARRLILAGLPAGHYAAAVAECRLGRALTLQSRLDEAAVLIEPALQAIRESSQAPANFEQECVGHLNAFLAATGAVRVNP